MSKALIISCFDWYKRRLEPIRDIFLARGYEVVILESDFDHIEKVPIKNRYQECTYIHVPGYRNNLSVKRIRSHLFFAKRVKQYIDDYKPDIIHVQIPPNKNARYCMEYKKKNPNTKLYLDIVDLWPESMPLGKLKKLPIMNKWSSWRNDCIPFADHVYVECELYKKKLGLDQENSSVLYLFKEQSRDERELIEEIITKKQGEENGIIKFAYLGSMNNIIDIENICSIIEETIKHGLVCELHAVGDGEKKQELYNKIIETGCKAIFYGSVFEEKEKIKILTPCDYAFNLMKDEVSVGLTMKSIDYLSYGLPLINNIEGDTRHLVVEEEIGINIGELEFPLKKFSHFEILKKFDLLFSKATFIETIEEALK